MAYSDFTLKTALSSFELNSIENKNLFAEVMPSSVSALLRETLAENIPLALSIASEKARSELIIINVLVEVRKKLLHQISLFSGIKFDVDADKNLNGYCDFIISASPEQLFIVAPVIAVVEAKNENIIAGLGQCVAEMVAAQQFNNQENKNISVVYGVVTSGNIWKFLQLSANELIIDIDEYYIRDMDKILGIMLFMLNKNVNKIP
jgi:hypothetical protein